MLDVMTAGGRSDVLVGCGGTTPVKAMSAGIGGGGGMSNIATRGGGGAWNALFVGSSIDGFGG
jgi:hypothetical protein